MQLIVATLFLTALSLSQGATTRSIGPVREVRDPREYQIVEDNRIHPENGIFSFDFKTENGIMREESGNENLVRTGIISYPLPDGRTFFLKFVADETGFKPESPFLPVAPVFPHPIPPHALEQIRRGEREHAEAAKRRAEERKLRNKREYY